MVDLISKIQELGELQNNSKPSLAQINVYSLLNKDSESQFGKDEIAQFQRIEKPPSEANVSPPVFNVKKFFNHGV